MDIGKQQVDIEAALDLSNKAKINLQRLIDLLKNQEDPATNISLEKVMPPIDKCSRLQSVLFALNNFQKEEHAQAVHDLTELSTNLSKSLDEHQWGKFNLTDFLQGLFHEGVQVKFNKTMTGSQIGRSISEA